MGEIGMHEILITHDIPIPLTAFLHKRDSITYGYHLEGGWVDYHAPPSYVGIDF